MVTTCPENVWEKCCQGKLYRIFPKIVPTGFLVSLIYANCFMLYVTSVLVSNVYLCYISGSTGVRLL